MGFSTKVHAVVDFKSRPIYLTLTPGQKHEMTQAAELLEQAPGHAFLGDTAYDSNDLAAQIQRKGMQVVICQHPKRKHGVRPVAPKLYRHRYRVAVFFHNLKRFRALASRYDKTAGNYLALLHLGCAWLWLN